MKVTKTLKYVSGMFALITVAAMCAASQEITLTTTAANTSASKSTIELPGLANNPFAIIVATPVGETAALNPHAIGAWYYNGKWNIHNTDHAKMSLGLTFRIEVFLQRDATHFLHVVTANDLHSFIDNPALNNNPNAQVKILQNHAPDSRTSGLNGNAAEVLYDNISGRWYIKNVNNAFLTVNTAYNVVVSSSRSSTNTKPVGNTATLPPQNDPQTPAAVGGDLAGSFPNPNVVGLSGRPLSNAAPSIGDTLRWNGTAWEPYTPSQSALVNANQLLGRDIMTTAPTAGQVLKFGGASWYPADDNVGTASPTAPAIQSFLKEAPNGTQSTAFSDSKPTSKIALLSHTIVLTKPSRLVISATVRLFGGNCPVGCSDGAGVFFVRVNGTGNAWQPMDFYVPHDRSVSVSISSYVRDLDPGTHTIDFWVIHSAGTSGFDASPMNSYIMVLPL